MNCLLMKRLVIEMSSSSLGSNPQNRQLVHTLRQLNTFSNVFRSSGNQLKQKLFTVNKQNNNCFVNEWQTMKRWISCSQEVNQLLTKRLNDIIVEQKRLNHKKGKKGKRVAKDETSDEESDADEAPVDEYDADLIDGKAIGFQDINASLVSLRLDNVLKSGLNMARHRVDEAFYGNLIRVNGERVAKKSVELAEDDEVDLIRGLNQENSDLIDVSRVVIKKIEDKMSSKERVMTKLRKFRNLTIENYKRDPYDGIVINTATKKEAVLADERK